MELAALVLHRRLFSGLVDGMESRWLGYAEFGGKVGQPPAPMYLVPRKKEQALPTMTMTMIVKDHDMSVNFLW